MKLMTVREISALYGIGTIYVGELIRCGRLPARRFPGRREWLVRERDWLQYEKTKSKSGRPRRSGLVVSAGLVPGFACPYPDCSSVLPSRHGLRIHLGTDHEGLDYEASRRCSRCHILFDEENPLSRVQASPDTRLCVDCVADLEQGHFVIAAPLPEVYRSSGHWAGGFEPETVKQQRWDRYNEKRRKA